MTDFKLRYQGSVLGYLWSVLKPLMLFGILYVVFIHFLKFGDGIPHFAVSLLLATVLWSFFTEATSQGMRAIVGRGDLLRKINFPKYIIVASATVSALINLLINLGVVIVFAIINGVTFSWLILVIPFLIIELYVLALALAFFLSALYVKFRDLGHIWEVVLQGMYFTVPVFYPLSMIAAMNAVAAKIILLNPITQIVQDFRFSLVTTQTDTVWNYIANPLVRVIPIVAIVALAVGSVFYFKKNSKKFAENI